MRLGRDGERGGEKDRGKEGTGFGIQERGRATPAGGCAEPAGGGPKGPGWGLGDASPLPPPGSAPAAAQIRGALPQGCSEEPGCPPSRCSLAAVRPPH